MSRIKYTDEELLNYLKEFYNKNGKSPKTINFVNNKDFPGISVYYRRFGSWNNSLKLANLPLNSEHGIIEKGNYCEICGSSKTDHWRSLNGNRVCNLCFRRNRNFINGLLNPNSNLGLGIISEFIIHKVLNNSIWYNGNIDTFNYKYDIYCEQYGNINVKFSNFKNEKNSWNFKLICKEKPDTYILMAMSFDKLNIDHMWIIPNNILTNVSVCISNTEIGLSRFKQYEVDITPYNKVYQNLDIYSLPEFCNLNKPEEVSV